jgi:myo-inositol-hexaphosphate 3-phosphohydrolase
MGPSDNLAGLAVWRHGSGRIFIIASLQNSWKYKVYALEPSWHLEGVFEIRTPDGRLIKSHDCIEAVSVPLGDTFPGGIFVTQNAANSSGYHFQIVSLQAVADALCLKKE